MNNNKLNATSLYNNLCDITYCDTLRDSKQEQDVLDVFINNKFEPVTLTKQMRTVEQKSLFKVGHHGLTKFSSTYHTGLYIARHPFGIARYPDFLLSIDGKIVEVEAKGTSSNPPRFTHGDDPPNPNRRDVIFIMTSKHDGTALLMPEDLISFTNYNLLLKHKKERDLLQQKHNDEFNKLCGGVGETVYHRTNISSRGGSLYTNHIERSHKYNLSKKVYYLLKTYEINGMLDFS